MADHELLKSKPTAIGRMSMPHWSNITRFDEFKAYVPPPPQYSAEHVASSQHALYIPDIILTTLPV
jgi:hypothetical protein